MGDSLRRCPNVVVVLTDQQRWDTAGCYGNPMGITPVLDRMASRGVKVQYAFSPQPVCTPARGSLQTGQYATVHGAWHNNLPLQWSDDLLASVFSAHGYQTAYVGKWHLGGSITEPVPVAHRGGYDYWMAADCLEITSGAYGGYVYDRDDTKIEFEKYRVDAMTDYACAFVQDADDRPYFLFLSYLEPHHQNDQKRFIAPKGYAERFRDPYVPADLEGSPGDWNQSLPDYYGMCARIDESLERILDVLDRAGQLDQTIVCFVSDHGCHFRTRNDEYKRSCHESSIRVPLVFQGPGFDGKRDITEHLVSLVDLPPTLLDAAGLPVPNIMQGRSIMPLLRGEDVQWPDDIFVQISESECGRALRTARWKYSVYAPDVIFRDKPSADVYFERYLYDLYSDPSERFNLIGRRDCLDIAASLRERLGHWIEEVEGVKVKIRPAILDARESRRELKSQEGYVR